MHASRQPLAGKCVGASDCILGMRGDVSLFCTLPTIPQTYPMVVVALDAEQVGKGKRYIFDFGVGLERAEAEERGI